MGTWAGRWIRHKTHFLEYDGYYGLFVYGHMPVDVGMQPEHDFICLWILLLHSVDISIVILL